MASGLGGGQAFAACSRFEFLGGNPPAGGRGAGAARVPQEKAPRRAGARPQPRGEEAAVALAPGGRGLPGTGPPCLWEGFGPGVGGEPQGSYVPK